MWILAALATLASVYAVYVINTAAAARVNVDRVRVEALIAAGLELTAYRLSGDENARPTSGAFEFQLGGSNAVVEFRSEGGRIDLNLAPKPLLSGLFAALGAPREDADFIADRIIGWRKKGEVAAKNEEAELYRTAGLTYAPRQAPFQNAAELRLVQGVPPDLAARALPFVTLFNGRAEIDVNVAAPEVIAALPNIGPDAVAAIMRQRDPTHPQAVLGVLGQARAMVATEGRKATRATMRIALDTGRRIGADVVILMLEDGPEPYRILSWRDDFDGPS